MLVFWVVMPCVLAGTYHTASIFRVEIHTALLPRRPTNIFTAVRAKNIKVKVKFAA
jgi:hypothetical protein